MLDPTNNRHNSSAGNNSSNNDLDPQQLNDGLLQQSDEHFNESGGGSSSNNPNNANVMEVEDPGLVFAAEALCDDLLTCKTDVLRHFARSRGAKSNAKANMVSELIEIASKTVTSPSHRSVARRILGTEIELPKTEGVRSAWTNETLEASMLEEAAAKKAAFSNQNYGASLRATSVRVSPISQRLLRALQDDFVAVSHAAVRGVHREYVESAKQIIERHEAQLSSLVAVFSTMLWNRIEHADVQDFMSSADIAARSVFLGLARPTIEGNIAVNNNSNNTNNTAGAAALTTQSAPASSSSSASVGGAAAAAGDVFANSSLTTTSSNSSATSNPALVGTVGGSSSTSSSNSGSAHTASLDRLMSMLDNVVSEVEMRQAFMSETPRHHNLDTRETFRRSVQAFKLRQITLKRDAVAVRRALSDIPPWATELARQFEVWETLVRSDIEDLRRAPAELFDLILVNVAASVASDKLHHEDDAVAAAGGGGGAAAGGRMSRNGAAGKMSSSTDSSSAGVFASAGGTSNSTVPGYYRQALKDAIIDFAADEGAADGIILKLNAYAAGKAQLAVNRPVIKQSLFHSVHVMLHGMVTDDVSEPPFERVALILMEFTRTVHRSERVASVFQLLVQLTESMHFHLRFAQVYHRLNEADKILIRRGDRTLVAPLRNFEQQQSVSPVPVSGVAFFTIVMLYFCIRAPMSAVGANNMMNTNNNNNNNAAGQQVSTILPIASRLESCAGIDELALVTLTMLKAHTVRSLPLSHPPRMTYTSWIDSATTATTTATAGAGGTAADGSGASGGGKAPTSLFGDASSSAAAAVSAAGGDNGASSSVYRLLPSDAVKSPTSNLMLTSRAPIIRALDAISRVPWRVNKMMLHVQEAILQEGYAFGKIRASFYPLSYARLQSGEITVGSPYSSANKHRNTTNSSGAFDASGQNESKNSDGSAFQEEEGGNDSNNSSESASFESNNNNSNNNHNNNINTAGGGAPPRSTGIRKLHSHRLYKKYIDEQNRNWRELLDTRSPRIHHIQALRQARALVNVARIYFPNNMDFRGRMYPMPGRLNHTGSDPFRATLEFAEPKPLGATGLYWLKVHLANKMGQTKISFADRVRWVDDHITDVVQSAESPLSGDRWWQEGDEPFQALTACKELSDALRCSQGPQNFQSRLPVAVDGSYNGLQHYSAIGRDAAGGALVNLTPQPLPSDAYTGILKEMMKSIVADAVGKDNATAQRCIGSGRGLDKNHVRRKTIKQSIMTQVYGVTDYGMAEQILTQLVNQNKAHGLWTANEMSEMSAYLRDKVNEALGETFKQTQQCRAWLAQVTQLIWKCQPAELRNAFSWTTPLGLIVRQPYRRGIETNVFTPVGFTRIKGSPLEPASPKQLSALAPNVIHSLDATHLAMTALEMQNLGMSMMAVHDSFWTYACDLPVLSKVLREQFVELYSNFDPLLELKQQWEELFFLDLRRHSVTLPDPPQRGTLDLQEVLKSPYFFS